MNDSPTTSALKAELWRMHGAPGYPSEWDGNVFGGGKLSQRYWEYFAAIEALDLSPESVVLDIGGGSPATGISLFPKVISTRVRRTIVMDASLSGIASPENRMALIPENCTYESLTRVFSENPDISHVSSVSVFEHITPEVRAGITRAIDESFPGKTFVVTLEYHATDCFFDHQLTARSLSETFSPMRNFYPTQFVGSPVFSEDAFRLWRPFYAKFAQKLFPGRRIFRAEVTTPARLWSPLLLKFVRL